MSEYIFGVNEGLLNEETGEVCFKPTVKGKLIRCRDCKWWNTDGCAIHVVDDSDKPKADDYCSFAEKERGWRS